MPSIDTLVDDIYAVLDAENNHSVNEDNVQTAGEAFKDLLRSRLAVDPEPRDPLRVSNLGKNERQLWYQSRMPEKGEKPEPAAMLKFLYGDVIELLLLFLAKEAGHTVTHEQHTVNIDGVEGHVDAIIDGMLVDVKSASPHSYSKFASGDFLFADPFGYVAQLSGYRFALAEQGIVKPTPDKATAYFLVCDKVSGSLCLAELDDDTVEANAPRERIEYLREVLSKDEKPRCCATEKPFGKSGNMTLDTAGRYCAWKCECFPGIRKFQYSNGVHPLTKVVRKPDVPEVE